MLTGAITRRQRRVDHIGGVEPSAEADFQQHHIGRMLREQAKGRRGLDLENGDRRAGIGPLAMFERRAQFVIADQHAAAGAAEPKAFVDAAPDRARCRRGRAGPRLPGSRADRRSSNPCRWCRRHESPAAACVRDDRAAASSAMHPLEAEIDALGMQRGQPRDQFAERRLRFGRRRVHACGAAGAASGADDDLGRRR